MECWQKLFILKKNAYYTYTHIWANEEHQIIRVKRKRHCHISYMATTWQTHDNNSHITLEYGHPNDVCCASIKILDQCTLFLVKTLFSIQSSLGTERTMLFHTKIVEKETRLFDYIRTDAQATSNFLPATKQTESSEPYMYHQKKSRNYSNNDHNNSDIVGHQAAYNWKMFRDTCYIYIFCICRFRIRWPMNILCHHEAIHYYSCDWIGSLCWARAKLNVLPDTDDGADSFFLSSTDVFFFIQTGIFVVF